MDGRTDIGVGIKLIEFCHELREIIITGKLHGTQLLTGRVNQIGKQGCGISNHCEFHQSPKRVYVIKQCVKIHSHQINKPEHIWNHKQLAERDQIINGMVHDMAVFNRTKQFKRPEQNSEDGPEQQVFQMRKLRRLQHVEAELPVINNRFQILFYIMYFR